MFFNECKPAVGSPVGKKESIPKKIMSKMRTARLVEIGRMEFEEIEMEPLTSGRVRVKTEMASICGSDLH